MPPPPERPHAPPPKQPDKEIVKTPPPDTREVPFGKGDGTGGVTGWKGPEPPDTQKVTFGQGDGCGGVLGPQEPTTPEAQAMPFPAKIEGIRNNLSWPVIFRRNGSGGDGFVLARGGTMNADSGEYAPQGAEYGDMAGTWRLLQNERKPEIRIDLSGSPAALKVTKLPQGEWNTRESEGWTWVESGVYVPPTSWSDEKIMGIWEWVVPADGSPADEYAWSHEWSSEGPEFPGGRFACGTTNVLTVTAARRAEFHVRATAAGPQLSVENPGAGWKSFGGGRFMPPEGMEAAEAAEAIERCVGLGAGEGGKDEYHWDYSWSPGKPSANPGTTNVLTVTAARRAEIRIIRKGDGPQLSVENPGAGWKSFGDGRFMPPDGMDAGDAAEAIERCVRLGAADKDDYLLQLSWKTARVSLDDGAVNVLEVTVTKKPDAVSELKNTTASVLLCDGRELVPGGTMDRLPERIAVKGDTLNRWICERKPPVRLDTRKGSTNTYTVAVRENEKPKIKVTNEGDVPVVFAGGEVVPAGRTSVYPLSGGGETQLAFAAKVSEDVAEVYSWPVQTNRVSPKWGETADVSVKLEATERTDDIQLELANPDGETAVEATLEGRHQRRTTAGEWKAGEAWEQRVTVGPGGKRTVTVPRTVAQGGVAATWRATGYNPASRRVEFAKGKAPSLKLAMERERQTVSIRNGSRIPLRAWLDGKDEGTAGTTIQPGATGTLAWVPRSGEKKPTVCYQPALDTSAWGIWGFEFDMGSRQWKPKEIQGVDVAVKLEINGENVAKKLDSLREAVEGVQNRGLQDDMSWTYKYDNALKALKGCGLTTGDLPGAEWPDFGELKSAVPDTANPEYMRVRRALSGASGWDDFMKPREHQGN